MSQGPPGPDRRKEGAPTAGPQCGGGLRTRTTWKGWGLCYDHRGQGRVLHICDVRHPKMESLEMESVTK